MKKLTLKQAIAHLQSRGMLPTRLYTACQLAFRAMRVQ